MTGFMILFIIHITVCILWVCVGLSEAQGKNGFTFVMLPLVIMVPLFGAICAFRSFSDRKKTLALKDDDLSVFSESDAEVLEAGDASFQPVSIEEALEVNDSKARHDLMMQIIKHDPGSNIDVLRMVRLGTDSEAAHYATTAIMEVQRQFDMSVQEIEERLQNDPDNETILDQYIKTLIDFIKSGLLQGSSLEHQRKSLADALKKKIEGYPDAKRLYSLATDNALALGQYSYATDLARTLCKKWPQDEEGWMKVLNVCMETGNAKWKRALESEIKNTKIQWSQDGKEYINYMFKGDVAKTW
ncbi:hypothetical protein LQZ18_12830 [Lachnospiraceae bacterium ZAX-1]